VAGAYQSDSAAFIIAGLKDEALPKSYRSSKDPDWIASSAKAKNATKPPGKGNE
jgi:hypothetical protein